MNTKLPIRRSENYSLLFIPEDHREIRRIRVKSGQIRFLVALILLGVVVQVLSLVGFFHYRSLYVAFEKERQANLEYTKERAEGLRKLATLESVVSSAEKFANHLAGLVGTERPELRKGIGAVKLNEDFEQAQSLTWQDLGNRVEDLEERAKSLDLMIQELATIQKNKLIFHASRPSIWPVKGWVTSEFGYRRSPLTNARDFHTGIDIASQWGTSVTSPGAGVVTFAGFKGGLGRAVVIDHGYGIRSYYGHASSLLVKPGQVVHRGTQIARIGMSGHSTGPHLHYEIHVDSVPIDPMKYILQ